MLIITVISPMGALNYTITVFYVPVTAKISSEGIVRFDSLSLSAVFNEKFFNKDIVLFVSILLYSFILARIF